MEVLIMARPTEYGLDSFPLQTNFNDDTDLFIAEMGTDGFAFLIAVWQIIYSNDGYFVFYNKNLIEKIKKRTGIEDKKIKELVKKSLDYWIFDVDTFNDSNILTSKQIQKTYFVEAEKTKKSIKYRPRFILVYISVSKDRKVSFWGDEPR